MHASRIQQQKMVLLVEKQKQWFLGKHLKLSSLFTFIIKFFYILLAKPTETGVKMQQEVRHFIPPVKNCFAHGNNGGPSSVSSYYSIQILPECYVFI